MRSSACCPTGCQTGSSGRAARPAGRCHQQCLGGPSRRSRGWAGGAQPTPTCLPRAQRPTFRAAHPQGRSSVLPAETRWQLQQGSPAAPLPPRAASCLCTLSLYYTSACLRTERMRAREPRQPRPPARRRMRSASDVALEVLVPLARAHLLALAHLPAARADRQVLALLLLPANRRESERRRVSVGGWGGGSGGMRV